jgi:endonuclease YncB( thermonuclease family)
MKPQTIILGVAITVLGVAAAAAVYRPQPNIPLSETWTVTEVIDGTTLNATQDGKTQQLQLCGIETAPGKEQKAVTYLQQLMDESNNQVAAVVVNRNQDKWLSEVFVSLGEDEELASGLLIMKGLAFVSQATDCPNGDALRVAEELVGQ